MSYSLVRNTMLPSGEEISQIKQGIAEREEKMKAVEGEISRLIERMESLDTRRKQLKMEIASRRSFISPIRKLHAEILQEIFWHCLPVTHSPVMCSHEAPLLLRQVCSLWRRLADESPELWASIYIVIPPLNPYSSEQKIPPVEEISSWLSRSGALPLSITLTIHTPFVASPGTIHPVDARYLEVISNPFKLRWRSIWINMPSLDWHNHFFRAFSANDVPLLEYIHVQGPRDLHSPPLPPHTSQFNPEHITREDSILYAPRLRSISILPIGAGLLQLSLKWENKTELNLSWHVFHHNEVTRALLRCPNLEVCVISAVDPRDMDHARGDPTYISLPKLSSLTIVDESDTESDISRLLRGLHAPNLCHFTYDRRPHWPPQEIEGLRLDATIDAISTLLRRLVNPLEELELRTDSVLREDVLKILSLVPDLKRLSLTGIGRPADSPYPLPSYRNMLPLFLLRSNELKELVPGRGSYDPSRRLPSPSPIDHSSDSDSDNDASAAFSSDDDDWSHSPNSSPEARRDCLCPHLEVIHLTGCMFSDSAMLEFLGARSVYHQTNKVTYLKKACISFVTGRELESGTDQELGRLEAGTDLKVKVICTKSARPRIRPRRPATVYDGLEADPFRLSANDINFRYPGLHF